jgi:hypothetical protein
MKHTSRESVVGLVYSRDDILRQTMALPPVVGIAAVASVVMLVQASARRQAKGVPERRQASSANPVDTANVVRHDSLAIC